MRTRPARLANVAGFNIDVVADAAGNDPDVLRLENLDTDLAPPPEAVSATRAAVGESSANSFLPFIGRLDLREAVADRVRRRSGAAFDPEREGDEVILTDPCYAGLVNRVRLAGAVPRLVPLRSDGRGWRLDRASRSPEDAIDGLIALCMALERCEARPEPVRVLGWV